MPASDAQKVAAIATVVLYGKYFICQIIQGTKKGKAGLKAPEDNGTGFSNIVGAATGNETTTENKLVETAKRWERIVGNDVENIPIALVIMWSCASIVTTDETLPFLIYAIMFTVARVLHTFCYAYGIQPFRTLCFAIGFIMVFCMAFTTLAVVFK